MASSDLSPVTSSATFLGLPDMKLSVASTLEQATKALNAHRAWMRRRVGENSVSPDTLLEGEDPEHKLATWAVGTALSQG